MNNMRADVNANRNYRGREEYVYGNTARALKPVRQNQNTQTRYTVRNGRNKSKAQHMNPAYMIGLTIAMVVTVCVCIQYLRLQSEVTSKVKELTVLETQLNDLRAENDDTESRIKGSVDLEEIKYRAMYELGMQYANEDQIVTYDCEDTDYVTQFIDVQ